MIFHAERAHDGAIFHHANSVAILRITSFLLTMKRFADYWYPNIFINVMTVNDTFPRIISNSHYKLMRLTKKVNFRKCFSKKYKRRCLITRFYGISITDMVFSQETKPGLALKMLHLVGM